MCFLKLKKFFGDLRDSDLDSDDDGSVAFVRFVCAVFFKAPGDRNCFGSAEVPSRGSVGKESLRSLATVVVVNVWLKSSSNDCKP